MLYFGPHAEIFLCNELLKRTRVNIIRFLYVFTYLLISSVLIKQNVGHDFHLWNISLKHPSGASNILTNVDLYLSNT